MKSINNEIFKNKNIIININNISKIVGANPSQNNILLLSFDENSNTDVKKYLNSNSKIIKKRMKSEKIGFNSERKYLDALREERHYLKKSNIIFDDKTYDIWNPNITLISQKNEEIQNKNFFYNINENQMDKKLRLSKIKKKFCKINFINQDKKACNYEPNYNNVYIYNKSAKEEINFPSYNNRQKRNVIDFFKIGENKCLFKSQFLKNQSINFDKNMNLINKIYTSRNRNNNKFLAEKITTKSLLFLSNLSDKDKNNNKIYLKKLISKSLSPVNNFPYIHKKKKFSSKFDMNLNDIKYKNRYIRNNLSRKEKYDINLEVEIDNFKKNIIFPRKPILNSSIKNEDYLKSLPNLNIYLTRLREKNKNSITKRYSYNFIPKKTVFGKFIKIGFINIDK